MYIYLQPHIENHQDERRRGYFTETHPGVGVNVSHQPKGDRFVEKGCKVVAAWQCSAMNNQPVKRMRQDQHVRSWNFSPVPLFVVPSSQAPATWIISRSNISRGTSKIQTLLKLNAVV